jgi:hypothetical protein
MDLSRTAARLALRLRASGAAGMLGVAWFAMIVSLLHLAGGGGGGDDWTRHFVSEFANGPVGWLFGVGLSANGVGSALVGLGLYGVLPRGRTRTAATTLFLCAAGGLVLAAAFNTDPAGAAMTAAGLVHRAAVSAAFVMGLVSLALFSGAFAARPEWRLAALISAGLTALAVVACIALGTALHFGWRAGLIERNAVAPFLAWEFWAAAHIWRHARLAPAEAS